MPDGAAAVEEPLVNTNELASVFGVSTNTIVKWRDHPVDPMPCETSGGNGVAYEYRLSACRAWYQRRRADEEAAETKKQEFLAQQRLEFLGLKTDDGQARLTAGQMKELAAAQLVIMQAAERRRALIHVDEVKVLLDLIMQEFQAGLNELPDWLEREFALNGEQVERAVSYADQIFTGALRQIAKVALEEIEDMPSEPELF